MHTATISLVGAGCFGLVIGWITYRTLRRREGAAQLSDIATVIGAVGGGAITTLFDSDRVFGWYAVGLAAGFFGYFVIGLVVSGRKSASQWMGD
jgi:hypothetical protein